MDIPSRYSVDQPDFDMDIGSRLLIALDGVQKERVVSYDAEAGWIDVHPVDGDGRLIMDTDGESIAIARLHGLVTVRWKGE